MSLSEHKSSSKVKTTPNPLLVLNIADTAVVVRDWLGCFDVHPERQRMDQKSSFAWLEELHTPLQGRP